MLTKNIDRQVVPRWRDFNTTVTLGELTSAKSKEAPPDEESRQFVAKLASQWQRSRTIWHAADLLNAAVVVGNEQEQRDAAAFVVENREKAPATLVRLATRIVAPKVSLMDSTSTDSRESIGQQIQFLRRRLREEGPSAIVLTDLARLYISTAKERDAVRTMLTACRLAPTNRFILRSAARLFLHIKDYKKSIQLLRDAPSAVLRDPWLTASEIAVSSAIGVPSAFAKIGFGTAQNDSYSPFARSELNSALATLEMKNGKASKARKLFNASLIVPNENSVAQAEYARRQLGGVNVGEHELRTARSFEANAYSLFNKQQWAESRAPGKRWMQDQPFSTRPAIFLSYLNACILEDYDASEKVLREALLANPGRPQLINNLAFTLASAGKVAESAHELSAINWASVGELNLVTLTATLGLVLMRGGHVEAGRQRYRESIELARKLSKLNYAAMAAGYLAREELIAGEKNAPTTLKEAYELAGKNPDPDVIEVLSRISSRFEETRDQAL